AAAGLPWFVPDEQVTTEIDGSGYLAAKTATLRAHATQIAVEGDREGGTGRRARSAGSAGIWSRRCTSLRLADGAGCGRAPEGPVVDLPVVEAPMGASTVKSVLI